MKTFSLESSFKLIADQTRAADALVAGIERGEKAQVLLGVTGSGKTFTLANVIARLNRPTLVISHNKTLAAQLYGEFKEFFPSNAVEYFVSYYDYYQPEAYIPSTDVYIEKDASINDRLDRLRLAATTSLMSRRDTVVVASVSCIYNLGSPEDYQNSLVFFKRGDVAGRDDVLRRLLDIQYERNDFEFSRGKVRVRGDVVEIFPAYRQDALRVEFFGDEIERIKMIDPLTGETMTELEQAAVYPAKHFVVSEPKMEQALHEIGQEMEGRVKELEGQGKLLEAQRLRSRTRYDMEMMREAGYCNGIENYSRVLSGRPPGARPYCLIDYFPKDLLVIIDESHVTIPQIRGMYEGDRSRKEMLVAHGFRLPSCLDNRPLKYDEFKPLVGQVIYVSATPDKYEVSLAGGKLVEQVIRPTGIPDPMIEVRPTAGQVENLLEEVRARARKSERVLVTTLTKRMSEDLADFLNERGVKVKYLHSDIETIERTKILQDLRLKKYDCLVGVNLLREGLDLPEVSLVAIFDADKQGFLRSQTSLIQTAGRAARNKDGMVIMYADTISPAMRATMFECDRRRKIQLKFNVENGITPSTIIKAVNAGIEVWSDAEELVREVAGQDKEQYEFGRMIDELERQMELSARNLEFEKAAKFRDRIVELKSTAGEPMMRQSGASSKETSHQKSRKGLKK
ncbi:MAG: excinuclease ABC subunit UvrB [Candidatus Omnitrophica bacterium]|nr:excinuclease ABC subunit UvrB [Candidatus Omnitrophota bacterium]